MLTIGSPFEIILDSYIAILLLRAWMQYSRCDFYNPFSQFIVKLTQPVIKPLRYIIPSAGAIDFATLFLAWLLSTIKFPLILLSHKDVPTFSVWYPLLGLLLFLNAAGSLLFWVIIARSIVSWVSQGTSAIDHILMRLTEPLMAPVRRYLPALGGLDFSGMVIVIALYFLEKPLNQALNAVFFMLATS